MGLPQSLRRVVVFPALVLSAASSAPPPHGSLEPDVALAHSDGLKRDGGNYMNR